MPFFLKITRPAMARPATALAAKRVRLEPLLAARPASPVFGGVMPPVPVRGAVTVGAAGALVEGAAGSVQVTVASALIGGVEKTPPRAEPSAPEPPEVTTTSYGPVCCSDVRRKKVETPLKVSETVLLIGLTRPA